MTSFDQNQDFSFSKKTKRGTYTKKLVQIVETHIPLVIVEDLVKDVFNLD